MFRRAETNDRLLLYQTRARLSPASPTTTIGEARALRHSLPSLDPSRHSLEQILRSSTYKSNGKV